MGYYSELHIEYTEKMKRRMENTNIMLLYLKKNAAVSAAEKLGYSDGCIGFLKNATSMRNLERIDEVMAKERGCDCV